MNRKKLIYLFSICLILISILLIAGCQQPPPPAPIQQIPVFWKPSPPPNLTGSPEVGPNEIKIGSFNLQRFGTSKMADPEIAGIISRVLSSYDLIVAQEVTDASNVAVIKLMNTEQLKKYNYIISPRLGRTTYKEQYLIIYNPKTVYFFDNSQGVYPDALDKFERDPYMARFRSGTMDFVIITIHTKPEAADEEIYALKDVLKYAQTKYSTEQNFMILGDLNSDCSYYEGGALTEHTWIIKDDADTTAKSSVCAYDRIITTNNLAPYFADAGVDRYDITQNLYYNTTIKVSDHYPVYGILRTD